MQLLHLGNLRSVFSRMKLSYCVCKTNSSLVMWFIVRMKEHKRNRAGTSSMVKLVD